MTITEHKPIKPIKPYPGVDPADLWHPIAGEWTHLAQIDKDGFREYYTGGDLVHKAELRRDERPAAAQKKRLKDEPWPNKNYNFRMVSHDGSAHYALGYGDDEPFIDPSIGEKGSWVFAMHCGRFCRHGEGYDATDWQNSLERRPE